jgi:hypothetical protein
MSWWQKVVQPIVVLPVLLSAAALAAAFSSSKGVAVRAIPLTAFYLACIVEAFLVVGRAA